VNAKTGKDIIGHVNTCAIFRHTSHEWADLCETYRESPYFKIGCEILTGELEPTVSTSETVITRHTNENVSVVNDSCSDVVQLTECLDSHEPYAVKCRESLRLLNDFTYLSTDIQFLKDLNDNLMSTLSHFKVNLPHEGGVALNVTSDPAEDKRRGTTRKTVIPAFNASRRKQVEARSKLSLSRLTRKREK
jgi:hypothetical protein